MVAFIDMFSVPVTPHTLYGPGQEFVIDVPEGARVVVTDLYAENHGPFDCRLVFSEQTSSASQEVRYSFGVRAGETMALHWSTGLRFGVTSPTDRVTVAIDGPSDSGVLPRVNGYFE